MIKCGFGVVIHEYKNHELRSLPYKYSLFQINICKFYLAKRKKESVENSRISN